MAQFSSSFSNRPLSAWIEALQGAGSADDRYRALLAVISTAPPQEAVRWCRHSLRDVDSGVRALAAKSLGELKRRVIEGEVPWPEIGTELAARLHDEDPDVGFEAARSLGRVNPQFTDARDVLLSLLDDEGTQPLMIAVVVSALGERPDATGDAELLIPRLRQLLAHSQAEVRENAAAVVAGLGSVAAELVMELIVALDDEEPIVRENAALALGRSGVNLPQLLAALTAASDDDDEAVAAAAREARALLS